MKKVYGYIRVSSIGQAMQGQSLDVQEDMIRKFFAYKLEPEGCVFAELIKDAAVSATINLRERPNGEHLDRFLEKGDHIIFSKLDRGFRNTIDLLQTVRDWQARGITVHMLDIGVDLCSEMGQLLMGLLGMFAEWERKRFRQRLAEGRARKKANAKNPTQAYLGGPCAPWGFMRQLKTRVGNTKRYRIVQDKYAREMARWFLACYEKGWDVKQIWYYCLQHRIRKRTQFGKWGEYTEPSIKRAMAKELELQAKEKAHPYEPDPDDEKPLDTQTA